MNTHTNKATGSEKHAVANNVSENRAGATVSQLADDRSVQASEASYQLMADKSPQSLQFKAYQEMADHHRSQTAQLKNNTGLPDDLKSGIENLSGFSMDDVKVHYNSDKPAQLQAHAYAQGAEIHIAAGQEKHLPHEAWHVVQQKQGRVSPTMQMKNNVSVNDDAGLEQEADLMGNMATQLKQPARMLELKQGDYSQESPVQRMLVGIEMETKVPIYENGMRHDHVDGYASQASEYDHENVDETLRQPLGKGFEIHVDSGSGAPDQALQLINPGAKIHIMEIVGKPVASRQALLLKLQTARNFLSVINDYSEVTGGAYSVGWPIPQEAFRLSEKHPVIDTEELERVFSRDYETGKGKLYQVASQLTFQVPPDHLQHLSDQDNTDYDTGRKEKIMKTSKELVYDKDAKKKIRKDVPREITRSVMGKHPIVDRDSMAEAMLLSGSLDNKYIRRVVDVTVKIFKDTLKFLQAPINGTVKNSVSYLIRSDLGRLFPNFPPQMAAEMGRNVATILELTTIDELNIPRGVLDRIYDKEHDALILNPSTFRSITNPPEREKGELEHINKKLIRSLRNTAIGGGSLWPWREAMSWLGHEVGSAISQHNGEITGPLHGSRNLGILPERNQKSEIQEMTGVENVSRRWLDDPEENPYPDEVIDSGNHDLGPAEPGVVIEDRAGLGIDISGDDLPAAITERLDQMGFPE